MAMDEAQRARIEDMLTKVCASAWLGHGDPLFLGFGDEVLPVQAGERHPRAPYQLDTNFAAWRVDGPIAARWSDDDDSAESRKLLTAAAESLVGERVLGWQVLQDGIGLRLTFTGSKVLTIEPWPVADGVHDAWSLSAPDRLILAVATDGRSVVVPAELPVGEWFPDAAT